MTLLLTAYSLLLQVQSNPNASIDVRNQATTVANQAIVFAEGIINAPIPTTTPESCYTVATTSRVHVGNGRYFMTPDHATICK